MASLSEATKARPSTQIFNTVTKIYLGSRVSEIDEHRVRQTGKSLGVEVAKMEIDAYSLAFKSPPLQETSPETV